MRKNSYFILYGNCFLVKGIAESIIYDLARCCYLPISNLLYDVLTIVEKNTFSVEETKQHFNNNFDQGLDRLFQYLEERGYGFYTREPELFPKISLEWDSPFTITNAVLEMDSTSLELHFISLKQLVEIGVQAVEFRIYDVVRLSDLSKLLNILENGRTRCVLLYLSYSKTISFEEIVNFYFKHSQVGQLIIHSAPESSGFEDQLPQHLFGRILQVRNKISSNTKDVISLDKFVLNMQSFTESYNYNLGLNRKVCIDLNGNIKNYLSHSKVDGNIKSERIKEIICKDEFKEIWRIKKDQIEVCKDCQYRYMCMDNSAIITKKGKLYRETNCNFDPYKNSWQDKQKY